MLLTLPSILDCPGCWGFTLSLSQVIFKIQITLNYQWERLWFFYKIKNGHIYTIFSLETECINTQIKTVRESTQNCFFSWSDVGHYWILHVESNYFDFMFIFISKIRDRCHIRLLFASISPQVFLALQAFYYPDWLWLSWWLSSVFWMFCSQFKLAVFPSQLYSPLFFIVSCFLAIVVIHVIVGYLLDVNS